MSNIRNPLHLEIIPSPGTQITDWETMEQKIEQVLPFAESIHIDIVDGKFAPNTTWMDPAPFAKFAKQVKLEVHLMTENPLQYVKSFADAGFQRFIGQVEKMPDIAAFVAEGQLWGEVGLAIDGPTPLEGLDIPLDDLDVVQLYTGEKAGFSGATMLPNRLEKVKAIRAKDPFIAIEIDGGVSDATILQAKDAGVTRFVTTGFLFSGNPEENFLKLKSLLK